MKSITIKKLVGLLFIGFLLLFILAYSSYSDIYAFASIEEQKYEPKEYCNATLDDIFDDNSILVVLDKNISEINKVHNKEFFGDIAIDNIYDLSYYADASSIVKSESFNQILKLELSYNDKNYVLNCIKELEKIDGIKSAEPNYYTYEDAQPVIATDDTLDSTQYFDQWGLHGEYGINAEKAWDITTGSSAVRVGVLDTGMSGATIHPDLANNTKNEGGDFMNMASETTNTPGPLRADPSGHGTHVAGIIGASGTVSGGVCGVAWNVQLIPLQISFWSEAVSKWLLSGEAFVRALQWAGANDIDIINFSSGGYEESNAKKTAISNFQGLFVCSAGNDDIDVDSNCYFPSDYSRNQSFSDRVISVGSSNILGGFSNNYGATSVSIFAPGIDILSTVGTDISSSGYAYLSGTSMAAPFVTGTAALMFSLFEDGIHSLTKSGIAAKVKTAIIDSAIKMDNLQGKCVANGRLDAYEALKSVQYITTNVGTNEIRIDGYNVALAGTVRIPATINGATVIGVGDWAFQDNTAVESIVYEESTNITTIGAGAFYGCTNLGVSAIPVNVTYVGDWAFSNGRVEGIVLNNHTPSQQQTIGAGAFGGVNFLSMYVIPESVTEIRSFAFSEATFYDDFPVTANSKLTTVGDYAFNKAHLYRMILSSDVTSMGSHVFGGCECEECSPTDGTVGRAGPTIFVAHSSRPSGWSSDWNSMGCPVVWGCTLSADKSYVVSVNKTSSSISNATAEGGVKNPVREDYDFGGWYTTSDFSGTQYTDITQAPDGTLYAKWTEESCVAEGTLITLADGSEVAVESLTGNEELLVWNMLTGSFESASILFIDSDPLASYEIIELGFSDGTVVKVISEHAFWCFELNEYVYLDENAASYIGYHFNKKTDSGYTAVELVEVNIYTETTRAYSPVTYSHLCYYVNGMLSMPGGISGFINIFEVVATELKYDEEAMERDIATYGLYTYEEFTSEIAPIPEEIFNAFNGQYLKVSIGKGLITKEEITALIIRYAEFF